MRYSIADTVVITSVTVDESLWAQAAREEQTTPDRGKAKLGVTEEAKEVAARGHNIFLRNSRWIMGTYSAGVHLSPDAKKLHITLSPTNGNREPRSDTTIDLKALRGDYFAFANRLRPVSDLLVPGGCDAIVKGDITRRLILVAAHVLPSIKTPAQG